MPGRDRRVDVQEAGRLEAAAFTVVDVVDFEAGIARAEIVPRRPSLVGRAFGVIGGGEGVEVGIDETIFDDLGALAGLQAATSLD